MTSLERDAINEISISDSAQCAAAWWSSLQMPAIIFFVRNSSVVGARDDTSARLPYSPECAVIV